MAKAPVKPKQPKKHKRSGRCSCVGGKVKEWGDGPYADYDWVTCARCEGKCTVTAERLNAEERVRYECEMKRYERDLATHHVLRTIKLSHQQAETLQRFGLTEFINKYLKRLKT